MTRILLKNARSNPSLCHLPDGSFLLAYKSRKENLGQLQVGVAHASHYTGPWQRQPAPWLFRGKPAHVEDPFVWYEDGRAQALMKDMTGEICGVPTHLFCATADCPNGETKDATRKWNIVFPLGG